MRSDNIKIWAHRGLSMQYPENTLLAFQKAAELPGLAGIELDVQYTKDRKVVVFHDETTDRVLEKPGNVRDFTLEELQSIPFKGADAFSPEERKLIFVPTIEEVLDLMEHYCRDFGQKINIELKTGTVRYEGIEQDTYDIVKRHNMLQDIVWSSFLPDSIKVIKEIDQTAETGMLAGKLLESEKMGDMVGCDAYHVAAELLYEITRQQAESFKSRGAVIRAWNVSEPLCGSDRILIDTDWRKYAVYGVTDIITNLADRYLCG